jgi:hypothetical protein
MHEMSYNNTSSQTSKGSSLLPPPTNLAEFLERVNVFSCVYQASCFIGDRRRAELKTLHGSGRSPGIY